jgi:hypothetical protein
MAVDEAGIVTEAVEREDKIDVEERKADISPEKEPGRLGLYHVTSHTSNHHDMANVSPPAVSNDKYAETGDDIYDKFSRHRKMAITAIVSFCGFLSPISSTAVLSAVPEVASTYNTSGSVINVTNALYLVFMGLSPIFWGPVGQVYGRRIASLFTANSRRVY